MDLSFISGPSTLKDMIMCNALPKETVKRSCEGYIGFLTIIDVATRNLWTHNVKSKDPPLDYINRFLKIHGIRETDPSKAVNMKITRTEGGYLAKSCAFESTVRESNFKVQPTLCNFVNHLMLMSNQVDAYITTDGGGELSKNHGFCRTANKHGYDVTSTATDASFQNGMVKHPHRTLKERI